MNIQVPTYVEKFLTNIKEKHSTKVTIREQLKTGKSGAFVAIVDCVGDLDGIHVFKVDSLPTEWEGEKFLHEKAISENAFSGKIPEIAMDFEVDGHYCLLIKLVGQSRILWQPLVADSRLFCSAYKKFSEIAWTPSLITLGEQQKAGDVISAILGYKLFPSNGGRIQENVQEYISPDFLTASLFRINKQVLPNPLVFATSDLDQPKLRPILGPTHGDCHSQNLFVKAGEDGEVQDINLIDFATYQSKSPLFFDHAYLELATLLQTHDGLGLARWFKLAEALARENATAPIDLSERGWLEDILSARKFALNLATNKYSDRGDDLNLQMLLAQIGAGLAFLHKEPRSGRGSAGLTHSQYCQSFLWSAVFLSRLFDLIGEDLAEIFPNEVTVPWPIGRGQETRVETNPTDLSLRLDDFGFNILILGSDIDEVPSEIASVPWSFVIDFRTRAPSEGEQQMNPRLSRQFWPGEEPFDLKILQRGCIWFFANGRHDLSGVDPASSTAKWRRTYKRILDQLIDKIARHQSPSDVRCMVLADGVSEEVVRMVIETIDMAFGETLDPVIVIDSSPDLSEIEGVEILQFPLDAITSLLADNRAASTSTADDALLPQRTIEGVKLVSPHKNLLARVERDLTVLYRARAQRLPEGRTFGVDFRRGMLIEWAELAHNIDVPREAAFDTYHKKISKALEASSNRTVNLYHEPSSGGTTLARRLAWSFMDSVPTVFIDQISNDTSSYLRDVFQFCSLPVLVVMETSVVTETEREGLLQQLREDNTRAAFLVISRAVKTNKSHDLLTGALDEMETNFFLEAYLEQVEDPNRQKQLRQLASPRTPREQRNPFFFGLTAFGENFVGIQRLLEDVIAGARSDTAKKLLSDLALVSFYNGEGFPEVEFDELCETLNEGKSPVDEESLFFLRTGNFVRVSHTLLAVEVLRKLARNHDKWDADIWLYSDTFLTHLSKLKNNDSDRIQRMVRALFISRDFESAIRADVDISVGGIASGRFSQLINDISKAEQARQLLEQITRVWSKEPHYAAHLARHLMYEDPKDFDGAVQKSHIAEELPDADSDSAIVHVAGMSHRIRMEQLLKESVSHHRSLTEIEPEVRSDFIDAIDRFERSTESRPASEHGLVATIQTVSSLLRQSMKISGVKNMSAFLTKRQYGFYMDALSLAEDKIDLLNNRPKLSIRAEKTIAEWSNVYGNTDRVVSDLRALANRYENIHVRRALCAAIVARANHKWRSINQSDLRTVVMMMEKNISQQGVRDADIRRWFFAFRHLNTFDKEIAIQRLIDWHGLNPNSVEPVYYLFALNFLRFLSSQGVREPLADEVNRWIKSCQRNRPLGNRSWSYDWLEKRGNGFGLAHFKSDLEGLDPPSLIKGEMPADLAKLEARLARVDGIFRGYKGPQFANLDIGFDVLAKITPLDQLSKDDEGKRVSAFISFSYDGLIGWDPKLVRG